MSSAAPDHESGAADARDVVGAYLREQCESVVSADVSLRQDTFLVHDTRVAIRRLRSTLRVFPGLFDPTESRHLDHELRWYATLLGAVRDPEVQRTRIADAITALPPELVLGPVREHLDDQLRSELAYHLEELVTAMASERYQELLTGLTRWADLPPYTGDVSRAGLVHGAKRSARKADHRLADALDSRDAAALHRARKAVKRARYAAELVEPLGTHRAAARIKRFRALQTALGTFQDSVLTAALLRRAGAGAGILPGHNGFTYGLLYADQTRAGDVACELAASL